jgi:4-amino-4-deoxy-L-arabinose transferase-like glycosyltransferase
VLLGVLAGAILALAWALPAGYLGGEAYRRAIFWGQTAGRVSESFAHRAPWWYYAPILPVILFPWLVWPAAWRALRSLGLGRDDLGNRFLAAWLVLTVVGFSFVSGKQAKYLVPMLPAFALLAGHAFSKLRAPGRLWEMLLPAIGFLALPGILLYARAKPAALDLPQWAATLPWWPAAVAVAIVPALLAVARADTRLQLRALAFAMLAAMTVITAGVLPAMAPYADPGPTAAHLAQLQKEDVPVAHLGKYHAQYNFIGRLQKPIEILDANELAPWAAANPRGQVIVVERKRHSGPGPRPEYEAPFRGAWIQLWRGGALAQTGR